MEDEKTFKVYCDSGANIKSRNEDKVTAIDLGFDTHEEWEAASEDEKMDAVTDYWHSQGFPEISWD